MGIVVAAVPITKMKGEKMIQSIKNIGYAIRTIYKQPKNLIELSSVVFVLFACSVFGAEYLKASLGGVFLHEVYIFMVRWVFIPLSLIYFVLRYGEGIKRSRFTRFFLKIGFWGYNNKVPQYMWKQSLNRNIDILKFRSVIPENNWQKKKEEIAMFLQSKIYRIKANKEKMNIMEIAIIKQELAQYIPWDDVYMEDGDVFAIGEGYEGKIFWKADSLHHGVVAGATSQGKTSLLRLLAYQAVKKNWNTEIIDMKNGGDYSEFKDIESHYGPMVEHDAKKACEMLLALTLEVQYRLKRFDEVGVANIQQYNARNQDQFLNWLLIIDEAAELLDVRPKDKEEKQMYAEIEGYLRTLARTSRAAGVHLVFGYIRPSSDVLDGQIKNNLLWRVCGYFADDAASRIVLDNDKATELPPDVKGRFIIGEDEVQTYYLEPQTYEPKVWCR